MNKLNYFGTSLDSAGHYFWILEGERIQRSDLWFSKIPFNPEELPKYEKGEPQIKGDVKFYHSNGYSICAIYGSCFDKRLGCRSVFFIYEVLTNNEMMQLILAIPIVKKIIDKMPFEVKW
jgi:hypothetical protein